MNQTDSDDDLLALRELVPPPAPRQVGATALAAGRERLLTGIDRERSASARRPAAPGARTLLVGAAACLALAVGISAVHLSGASDRRGVPTASGAPSAPGAAVPDAAAVAFLDRVAAAAASAARLEVREDQFVYVRSTVRSNTASFGEAPTVGAAHQREVWLSQDPSVRGGERNVLREFGQDWEFGYGEGGVPAGLLRPTYAWLQTLPEDPDVLLALLRRESGPAGGQDSDHAAFLAIGQLLAETVLPPRTAGTLYEAATRLDGITVVPGVTDAVGRPGFALSHTDTSTPVQVRAEWIFSRDALTYLGSRSFFVGRDGAPDQLVGADAVLERAVVDTPRQVPAPAASGTGV